MRSPRVGSLALALVLAALVATGAQGVTTTPIRIGVLTECTGALGAFRDYPPAGAELALIERGANAVGPSPMQGVTHAQVRGRPIALSLACTDGSATSALEAARRLVEQVGVSVLIGPLDADEEIALQEYAARRPRVAFVDGSASAQILHPARNFFNFHGDGAQWSAGEGSYAYNVLGWRRAVTVTDEHDAFEWAQTAGFDAEFCALGGSVVSRIGIPSGTQDFSGVVAQLPRRRFDGIFVASSTNAPVTLVKTAHELRGSLARKLLVGIFATDTLANLVHSPRLTGLVWANWEAKSAARSRYLRALSAHFPKLPKVFDGVFDEDYYVAMRATLTALDAVGGDPSHRARPFLAALGRVRLRTPSGPVRLDAHHRAIVTNYLWQLKSEAVLDARLLKTIANVGPLFGGYFGEHDPPPQPSTPVCRKGHVAPWAHPRPTRP